MQDAGSFVIFLIASFVFAWIISFKRDTIPEKLRKPLAMIAIGLVTISFVLLLFALYSMGE